MYNVEFIVDIEIAQTLRYLYSTLLLQNTDVDGK